jgi:RNA polymerase sigma factor (TIGR02999 family)
MPSWEQANLTHVLEAVRDGNPEAEAALFAKVHNELHRLAQRELGREYIRPTLLQTTGLINEAWLRMSGGSNPDWKSRSYFFGAAAKAMRRVLVDLARRRKAQRRGGGLPPITLTGEIAADAPSFDALMLNEALDDLQGIRPRAGRVVELRFFGGLTVPETAQQLGISPRQVDSDWSFARRWLERRLSDTPPPPSPDPDAS